MSKNEEKITYDEWLEKTDLPDNKENKSWFNCPEDKRSEWIKKHSK